MRISIDHQTGFRYSSRVGSSYNEARMTPVTNDHQTVWSSRVGIDPTPWNFTYPDYWGTTVTPFELHEPHERLTVHAQSVVETRGDHHPWDETRNVPAGDLGWPALHDRGVIDSMAEFLTVNERTAPPEDLVKLARQASAAPPRLAALPICRSIAERLAYERGSTSVNSTAAEAWAGGRGVCQDYSHVAL